MDGTALRRAGAQLLELVLPDACVGCDAVGPTLCASCRGALVAAPSRRTVGGLPVTSGLVYDDVVRRAVVAFKNEGRTGLARPLGVALRAAVVEALPDAAGSGIALVPMPRTRRSAVERGYDPVRLLLARARLPRFDLLRTASRPADQLRLGRADRFANLAGAFAAPRAAGRRVLLIDDVVTSGATLAEAARAVRDGGGEVVGAATLAATPAR